MEFTTTLHTPLKCLNMSPTPSVLGGKLGTMYLLHALSSDKAIKAFQETQAKLKH